MRLGQRGGGQGWELYFNVNPPPPPPPPDMFVNTLSVLGFGSLSSCQHNLHITHNCLAEFSAVSGTQ